MKHLFFVLSLSLSLSMHAVQIGEVVKGFSLTSETGEKVSLKQFYGKNIVLEWFNHGCPFVRKHYDVQNMQNLQEKWVSKGVVWLTISSSAKDKQGHLKDFKEAYKKKKSEKMKSSYLLLDHEGTVGKQFGAKTTPHMFIINKKGKLIYKGAIDSIASARSEDIQKSKNYVDDALESLSLGNKVLTKSTKQYGCSVKY